MNGRHRSVRVGIGFLGCALAGLSMFGVAAASEFLLKDGRILKGIKGESYGLADQPNAPEPQNRSRNIVFLDDDLRRTFFSRYQIAEARPDSGPPDEKFTIKQPQVRSGPKVAAVGPPKEIKSWDEFGRRTFTMITAGGTLPIIQAMTEITPQWTRVEAVKYTWDLRIATSSIPRDTLHRILLRLIDKNNLDHRKKIVRFYNQCERYEEASQALQDILNDFGNNTEIKEQLEPVLQQLRRLQAQQRVKELKLRRAAGQHQLVQQLLGKFPTEGAPGEILQEVKELLEQYQALEAQRAAVIQQFAALLAQIKDKDTQNRIAPIGKEIAAELSMDTLPRMAAFLQNLRDPQLTPEEKLALAISGWLAGADRATPKLSTALSTVKVREMARTYLVEPSRRQREGILNALPSEEGGSAKFIAHLLSLMKPPWDLPEPVDEKQPGYYKLEAPGLPKEGAINYYVQLPPEYDPHRRYPMIVSLHSARTNAELQIEWWAGPATEKGRLGQAGRYGYIVMAPEWAAEHQAQYGYSAREHNAVLSCLRDACRRFAVDTDRVFLSGHSMGGDAAWDIGLAHPDLWAGVVPISADSQKYCKFYTENARYVPFYVVLGELDGTPSKMIKNAPDLDRYFGREYNTTVVEYLGRGHEHFSDEVLRLFDWMGRYRRNFFPREFTCSTLRQWDNFFWWVEVDGLPPATMIDPSQWGARRTPLPAHISGTILPNNNLKVNAGNSRVTVWISPEMVNLKQQVGILVKGQKINSREPFIQPNLETLLEDVRTRGDRQHPFWAKVVVGGK